ncbi:Bacteriocin resistance protein; peptidase C39 [hydrothermal vent metagenome]|uniref:Bacteriocin resistance protein peptidase C39 n=1 Tax=hydrothermal vent metagenome TaxID=652676 RepID=A0A3B0ZC05_9ZZZZ
MEKNLLKKTHCSIAILFLCGMVNIGMASEASLFTATLQGQIPIKTWKDLRDEKIVKQDLDYSCGAASVATIMNGFYGLDVTEAELLDRMEADGTASFQDLAEVVQAYGLKGMGIALNFEQLHQLKVPAIAYLKYRDDDHFSVVRSVNPDGSISLGDPSWGNRRFTQQQFLEMWETRGDENLKGKVLLLLPDGIDVTTMDRSFFGLTETNTISEEMLILRY